MQIEAGVSLVGAGWQNRRIVEKPKPEAHGRPPYTRRPARERAGHWWELLTRTLAGRLVLLLGAVALIGLVTAAFGHFALDAFPSFGEAVWSAIAHLVDPGSIGDDDTAGARAIGLLQVIAGIVFFAGIVLTVLTEVIDRALRRMQKGDPAVRREDHLLVVGFNPSLREVQARLRESLGPEPPEVVVMLPLAQADRRDEAHRALAGYPARASVVAAEPGEDGYGRVAAREARHIVVLSPEGEPDAADLEATDRATLLARHLAPLGEAGPAVAVELRRGRNVRAFWFDGGDGAAAPVRRFPANFDALVNDRNIGAILTLAVTNPVFAPTFLDDGPTPIGPLLKPAPAGAGLTFGRARAALAPDTLLGVLTGSGPAARASYLPGDGHPVGPGDRLIVIPGEGAGSGGAARIPDSVKVSPTRPGPLLMIGWSDASRALIEDLEATGADLGRVHLLGRGLPAGFRGADAARFELVEGDPAEPAEIAAAISRVEPEIVWVAAPGEDEAGAIIAGMLARQETEAPIVVEQSFSDRGRDRRVAADVTVVSTARLLAETISLSLADPAVLVARERMLDDPGVALESLTYAGPEPLPLSDLAEIFGRAGTVPLAVSLNGDDEDHLRAGDHILALQRVEPPPA